MGRRVAVAVVLALGVVAGNVSAGGKAGTTVNFTHLIPTGSDGSYFEGSITSSKKACKNDRKVVVFRQKNGDTVKIGSTQSERNANLGYKWVLEQSEHLQNGTYWAKAPETDVCKADKSPEIQYQAS